MTTSCHSKQFSHWYSFMVLNVFIIRFLVVFVCACVLFTSVCVLLVLQGESNARWSLLTKKCQIKLKKGRWEGISSWIAHCWIWWMGSTVCYNLVLDRVATLFSCYFMDLVSTTTDSSISKVVKVLGLPFFKHCFRYQLFPQTHTLSSFLCFIFFFKFNLFAISLLILLMSIRFLYVPLEHVH